MSPLPEELMKSLDGELDFLGPYPFLLHGYVLTYLPIYYIAVFLVSQLKPFSFLDQLQFQGHSPINSYSNC